MYIATKQKQFLGAWRNYRSGAAADNNESEKGGNESGTDEKEKVCCVLFILDTNTNVHP